MKFKKLFTLSLLLFAFVAAQAQQDKPLSLDEAIRMAVNQSTGAALADTRVNTAGLNVANTKNNAYPDFRVSGQYMRVTNPTVNFKIPLGSDDSGEGSESGSETTASPQVNQVMFGQASLSLPVFSGFRLKNSIKASEDLYKAESFAAADTKEQLAMQAIMLYTDLYKAQESVALIQENLKSANQRVTDFTAMEENGLLARNDLLRAQLQSSNIELSLEDARKNINVINYRLVTLLGLPEGTMVKVDGAYFKEAGSIKPAANENEAIAQRNDLEALRWQQKASEENVKVARADYYPSLALSAGYVALDIQNVVQVYNAVNFGVGISYDLAGIFKTGKKVQAAESRAKETSQQVALLTENIKVQVQQALENYNLAVKQNKVYTQAVAQAGENYRIVKDKYDNGLVDTNDLLEADIEQLQAQLNETFSKADITQRYYELLNATGKLTDSFNITENN